MRRGGSVAAVALLLALAGRAEAFSRFRTDGGKELYWKTSCVVLTVYLEGFTRLTEMEVLKSVAAAARAWSPGAVACGGGGDAPVTHPYVEIVPVLAPPGAVAPGVRDADARSTLVFRTQNWTDSGRADGEPLVNKGAAFTLVHRSPDGHITDADILINAVDKEWANLDPGVNPRTGPQDAREFVDLQNTLTHELGHLLGLDHTCFRPSAGKARWTDDHGDPVPDCQAAPGAVLQTVMFDGNLSVEETSKRELSADEIAAMCTIYPAGGAREACALDVAPAGCGVAASTPDGFLGAVALALAALRARVSARGRARA